MRPFRAGQFERSTVPRSMRGLCPVEAIDSLTGIDLEALAQRGKKLVLLDVDNTLTPWRGHEISEEIAAWIKHGHELGMKFCIVSNSKRKTRLRNLATALGVDLVMGRMKPSRHMFRTALTQMNLQPGQAIMVGDQLFTDVLGANRAGIEAILVRPMHPRELFATKVNRFMEGLVRTVLDRSLISPAPGEEEVVIGHFHIARQFLKFCIVGASCFIIDAGLHRILMFHMNWGGQPLHEVVGTWALQMAGQTPEYARDHAFDAAFAVFKVPTAALAILNSFVWNRLWTFGIRGSEDRGKQFSKFVLVALIGLGLNTLISSGVNRLLGTSDSRSWIIATVVAAGIVAIWNFSGQRLWAFRRGRA